MSKTMKKVLSMVCAITLVVSSMTGLELTKVSADTTTTIILDKTVEREALLVEIADPEVNFALEKEASVSQLTTYNGGTDLSVITNGQFSTADSSSTIVETGQNNKTDFAWVQVDLGNAYDTSKIDRIAVQYKTKNSGPKSGYKISYSLNGVDFVDVATVDGYTGSDDQICLDKISLTSEQAKAIPYTKFIRVTSTKISDTSGYGMQIKGMAVLTDGTVKVNEVETMEMPTIDNPASVTVTSSDYCQLEYVFMGAEGHDDYRYYAYIDGSRVEEAVLPGIEYKVTGLTAGEHQVKIVSFSEGFASEGIVQTVTVKDYTSLISDERNIAFEKTVTSDSVRDDDVESKETRLTNLTDGKITGNDSNLYRTEENSATASIVIDLGDIYKAGALERIIMVFKADRYAQDYTVECSLDGEIYEQIGSTTGENSELTTIELDATQIEATEARYIRINFTKGIATAYGYQIFEIAIIENYIDIAEAEILVPESVSYTGETIEPELTLTYKEKQLVVNKDYEVVYSNNTAVGTANVIINGLGRYTGSVEKTFEIVRQDVNNVTVNTSFDDENELVVSIANGNTAMVVDADYTYQIGEDEEGNITVIVEGIGDNYTGTYTKTISLTEVPVNEAVDIVVTSPDLNTINVQFSNPDKLGGDSQTYNIYIDDELVDENIEAGTYRYDSQTVGTHNVKVVASLAGKESAGISNEITVDGKDISSENVIIEAEEILPIYSGLPMQIGIVVKYGEDILTQDVDYTIEFSDNINAGTAKYKVIGMGLYTGTVEGEFTIGKKELSSEDIKIVTSFDKNKELVVEITDGRMILAKGIDYNYTSVTDSDYNVTVTIIALDGNYTGSTVVKVEGKVNPNKPEPTTVGPTSQETTTENVKKPAQVKIKKVKKAGKKKVKVSWKKIKGAKGYQIRYSTSKKFKKATKKLVRKNKTTYTIKKLKNKKYYIQVRAYVVKNGKRNYGKWSKRKSVKINK